MDVGIFRTAMSPGISWEQGGDCFPMIANKDGKWW